MQNFEGFFAKFSASCLNPKLAVDIFDSRFIGLLPLSDPIMLVRCFCKGEKENLLLERSQCANGKRFREIL